MPGFIMMLGRGNYFIVNGAQKILLLSQMMQLQIFKEYIIKHNVFTADICLCPTLSSIKELDTVCILHDNPLKYGSDEG